MHTAFLGTFTKFRRRLLASLLSVCLSIYLSIYLSICPSAWNNSNPNEWIFMKYGTSIFRKSVENIEMSLNVTRILGTLHDDQNTFMISPSVHHRMRNVTDKILEGNQHIHLLLNNLC